MRVQGCFVSDKEVEKLIEWWKKQTEEEKTEDRRSEDRRAGGVCGEPQAGV